MRLSVYVVWRTLSYHLMTNPTHWLTYALRSLHRYAHHILVGRCRLTL